MLVPADEGLAGFYRPGGGTPSQTGDGSLPDEGHVLEMLADDLAVTEIMMFTDETVVEGFHRGVPDHGHRDGTVVSKTTIDRRLIHDNRRNQPVSFFIPTVMLSRRQFEITGPLQSNQRLPAGHVFQSAIGLSPVPSLAENSGDGAAAVVPMLIDNGLDQWQIGVGNGPFSDGDRQHDHRISKRIRGRRQKMHEIKKYFSRQFELEAVGRIGNGLPICWVEMKKGGLKMSLKSRARRF